MEGYRPAGARAWLAAQVRAIRDGDSSALERTLSELSHRHRILGPLGLAVGAFAMLFEALRLLSGSWRLMLVGVLPAMWIWLAMLDLKVHVWYGRSFLAAPLTVAIPVALLVPLVTAVGLALNVVFAFAIAGPGSARIRPAFAAMRGQIRPIAAWGLGVGLALGLAALIAPRGGRTWFVVSMSVVVGLMMLTYVTVPARLAGIRPRSSRRDAVGSAVVAGTLGTVVCAPGYLLGRLGLLMLDSHRLFMVGSALISVGFVLQAGATGAVRAIKISAKLLAGRSSADHGGGTP